MIRHGILTANGGGGGGGVYPYQDPGVSEDGHYDANPAAGGAGSAYAGFGGNGGAGASPGGVTAAEYHYVSGGGGGAAGWLHVNSQDANADLSGSTLSPTGNGGFSQGPVIIQ
jgi:hypothetical protein